MSWLSKIWSRKKNQQPECEYVLSREDDGVSELEFRGLAAKYGGTGRITNILCSSIRNASWFDGNDPSLVKRANEQYVGTMWMTFIPKDNKGSFYEELQQLKNRQMKPKANALVAS